MFWQHSISSSLVDIFTVIPSRTHARKSKIVPIFVYNSSHLMSEFAKIYFTAGVLTRVIEKYKKQGEKNLILYEPEKKSLSTCL